MNKRAYTLYSLGRLLFDEAALVAVVLWLLPRFGINIPVWLLTVFMVAWAVYSCLTSRLVAKVIGRAPAVGTETLIGVKCTTTTPLLPDGYVRIATELWRARSMVGDIEAGAEVVIIDINRLTLIVRPSIDTILDESQHVRLKSEVSCTQNECHNSIKSCKPRGDAQLAILKRLLSGAEFRTALVIRTNAFDKVRAKVAVVSLGSNPIR